MKSHIQLNKGWMKYFQNKIKDKNGKQTYCLTLPDLKIISTKIGTLGTKENYYVQDVENFYNEKFEKQFGEILNKITKDIKPSTATFNLSEVDKEFIQKFMAINISRSPLTNIQADLQSNSPLKFITPPGVLSLAVYAENLKYFENYKIRFIYNNSNTGFILPSYCHYRTFENEDLQPIAVIPITDKIAIVFDNNPCIENSVTLISDENIIINKFNLFAFIVELYTNCNYLISKTEKPLIDIQKIATISGS